LYPKIILNHPGLKKISIRYQRTFKQLLLLILILTLQACNRPSPRHEIVDPAPVATTDINTNRDIPESHKAFLARFLPEIHSANNKVLHLRNRVLDLQDTLKDEAWLSQDQLIELNRLLKKYRIDVISDQSTPSEKEISDAINNLLKRLDIIPVKLVMAQAIIESGWGSSSFARDGNNYFGVHCYTEGCGVKPAGNDSADFYVKTYPSEMAGIDDYIWILNIGHAYRGLRQTRLDLRKEGKPIDPIALAQGLSRYSAKGEEYVTMVSNIIRNYIPENADELLAGNIP